jgi:hypothetical protein
MAIQTEKEKLIFQLRAYHGYSKEDLEGKTIKDLRPLLNTKKQVQGKNYTSGRIRKSVPKQVERFNVENWKGKKVYVERDFKGRIVSYTQVNDSKLTKQQAQERLKEKGTLKKNENKIVTKMTNFNEIVVYGDNARKPPRRELSRKKAQYVCECDYNGEHIVARSFIIGTNNINNTREAKQQARNKLTSRLSAEINDIYAPDMSLIDIKPVTNYREGWVYYESI